MLLNFFYTLIILYLTIHIYTKISKKNPILVASPPSTTQKVQATINEKEKQYSDLNPNNKKTIKWFKEERKKTPICILYLHDFLDRKREMHSVCEKIRKEFKANIFYNRFKGHGRNKQALKKVDLQDWLADGKEALEVSHLLGEKTIIIATGMGALVACYLASIYGEKIKAMILISPLFASPKKEWILFSLPGGTFLGELFLGKNQFIQLISKEKNTYTISYPTKILKPITQLIQFSKSIDYHKINAPTMILYKAKSKEISLINLFKRFNQLGSKHKKLYKVKKIHHYRFSNQTMISKPTKKITEISIDFLNQISSNFH